MNALKFGGDVFVGKLSGESSQMGLGIISKARGSIAAKHLVFIENRWGSYGDV